VRAAQSSIFNGLRLRHPQQPVLVLPEPFMQAISRALERTASAHPDGILAATFQRLPASRIAEPRWTRLALTAQSVVLFAGYPHHEYVDGVWHVPVSPDTPLGEEWAVVCDTPSWWGCLVGREVQGARRPAPNRAFEAMWSLEPDVVRDAARIAATLATDHGVDLHEAVASRLRRAPDVPASTLRETSCVTNRVLEELLHTARGQVRRA
jgi:DICT domain-containing protein